MQTIKDSGHLKGRANDEIRQPLFELKSAIANYLEEMTDDLSQGQILTLPAFDSWDVPANDLLDCEVASIAGDAGYHIESKDDGGFIFYGE